MKFVPAFGVDSPFGEANVVGVEVAIGRGVVAHGVVAPERSMYSRPSERQPALAGERGPRPPTM